MPTALEMKTFVDNVLSTQFNEREGRVVPESEDLALAGGAVKLDATFLYADLAGTSKMALACPWETTAKIIRAYLDGATRLIRANGGDVRSFDGDRVMGVFIGSAKNTSAVTAARQIDWLLAKVLGPKAEAKFKSLKNNGISIRHGIGVDTGTVRAVRAGIRGSNDLIWIGRAPSMAAKLSDIREHPYEVFVSDAVFSNMNDSLKQKQVDGSPTWEQRSFTFGGVKHTIHRTKYTLPLT